MNSGPGLEPHENAQAFTPESPEFVHCTHREHARYMDGGRPLCVLQFLNLHVQWSSLKSEDKAEQGLLVLNAISLESKPLLY